MVNPSLFVAIYFGLFACGIWARTGDWKSSPRPPAPRRGQSAQPAQPPEAFTAQTKRSSRLEVCRLLHVSNRQTPILSYPPPPSSPGKPRPHHLSARDRGWPRSIRHSGHQSKVGVVARRHHTPLGLRRGSRRGYTYRTRTDGEHLSDRQRPRDNGKMTIPVRCFTCGKVIGNKWETYLHLLQADFSEG